ncbi:MAG: RdgB/HAM1 family non-canonical purine NTP pyrophosphatase [Limnobacter sp.]|jgi:XTP/dITP diphosphohydrolase|uniref:RdgB/HAM1 family non-canonical purine NTP pyrophosphatase n=1 Tax=Limnobacter sp. TaxID=2003368 RepID=UPI0011FD5BD9|nr:RdgB/HAM1 family non-canonical purine NTP pyrophosphatase [Limnobacter sp.]MDZ4050555.1 RdgB/HAM1 family non-canonical purine NTP pyrophosphatase [Limnobacter sp.]RZO93030.1 MAG: RdgB/HAM1 family non-canonical purine NTP pyrophosphatase [Limnobacter sp.]
MVPNSEWVLASGNKGKLREFQDLFAPWGVNWVAQGELGVPDAEEPFHTFVENALTKARHASRLTGRPALADDSGLCVPAIGGAPGVLSARYATLFGQEKSDANNNACLVEKLKGIADRRAYFVCAMVWVTHADDPTPTIAQKMWWGEVIDTPQGEHGFGYDPHFWLPEHQCTAAQMPKELKNRFSHRAQATQALLQELQQRLGLKKAIV